ncbi:hypothetical protein CN553_25640, partial [Bacillus cereus]
YLDIYTISTIQSYPSFRNPRLLIIAISQLLFGLKPYLTDKFQQSKGISSNIIQYTNISIYRRFSDRVAAVIPKMVSSYSKKYGFIININVCFLQKGFPKTRSHRCGDVFFRFGIGWGSTTKRK